MGSWHARKLSIILFVNTYMDAKGNLRKENVTQLQFRLFRNKGKCTLKWLKKTSFWLEKLMEINLSGCFGMTGIFLVISIVVVVAIYFF